MSTTIREKGSSVTDKLIQKTKNYSFIQVVRLLEHHCARELRTNANINNAPRPAARKNINTVAGFSPPETEMIRFHTNQKLDFFSADLYSLYQDNKTNEHENKNSAQWNVQVNMMGLTGAAGVLPYHYTELVLQRLKLKDSALKDFLELFNHRSISLYFQASVKYRLAIEYERERINTSRPKKDLYTNALLAIIGLGTKHLQNRLYTDDESLIYYSGLFSQQVKTASGLKNILQRHFSVPIKIEEFIGQWQDLIDDVRTRITSRVMPKGQNASLSRSAILGKRGWYAQGKIRIVIGPLDSKQLKRFSPGTSTLKALNELVRFYAGIECNYDFVIQVKRIDIPEKLALDKKSPPILGWNACLPKSGSRQAAEETIEIVVPAARPSLHN